MSAYDIAYGVAAAAAAPFWLARSSNRRKALSALRDRMGHVPAREGDGPAVMIHAVSLGEINATRKMVQMLTAARPDLHVIISVTTDTGFARGQELYGSDPRIKLIRFPLDLTSAVNRMLDALRPEVVALMELEVWPNFVRQCGRRGIPVGVVNGRLTSRSYRNYRLAGPLVRQIFSRLAFVCAQDQTYADRFVSLGVPRQVAQVTGTMKFDTAQIADSVCGADELARAVGLRPGQEPIWVCGSTGPGEETFLLRIYRDLLRDFPGLRLVLVPRKPERFDEVANLIRREGFDLIRRSQSQLVNGKSQMQVVLGDTMGELRKFYSLADVVLVGRTLVDLGPRQHGSDMIEPAALAEPVVVGPFTGNFAEVMNVLRSASAIREVGSVTQVSAEVAGLLRDREPARAMGLRAQDVVRRQQGATARHVELILQQLDHVRKTQTA